VLDAPVTRAKADIFADGHPSAVAGRSKAQPLVLPPQPAPTRQVNAMAPTESRSDRRESNNPWQGGGQSTDLNADLASDDKATVAEAQRSCCRVALRAAQRLGLIVAGLQAASTA
jgi:hypothetical protein